MSTLRVFFDADVLLAGSASTTGASHILLKLSELTLVEGITSHQAQTEAERNLLANYLLTFNVRHCWPRGQTIRVERPGELLARIRRQLANLGRPPAEFPPRHH